MMQNTNPTTEMIAAQDGDPEDRVQAAEHELQRLAPVHGGAEVGIGDRLEAEPECERPGDEGQDQDDAVARDERPDVLGMELLRGLVEVEGLVRRLHGGGDQNVDELDGRDDDQHQSKQRPAFRR